VKHGEGSVVGFACGDSKLAATHGLMLIAIVAIPDAQLIPQTKYFIHDRISKLRLVLVYF